jgi:AhpD family alkylhydroperoxidase
MKFRDFPRFDDTNAPDAAREPLAQSKRTFGAIPEPLARYASSPLMLGAALRALETFEKSSLAPLEREVLAMTMGRANGCQLCVNLHRRLLQAQQAPADVIAALETGTPLPARLEALRQFIHAALAAHGDVPRAAWLDFRTAGFSHEQALDVLLGISTYTLTTLANRLTETSE